MTQAVNQNAAWLQKTEILIYVMHLTSASHKEQFSALKVCLHVENERRYTCIINNFILQACRASKL